MGEDFYHKKTSRRMFHCPYCGHHLRLGSGHCGDCYQPTPIYNRTVTLFLATMIVFAAIFVTLGRMMT